MCRNKFICAVKKFIRVIKKFIRDITILSVQKCIIESVCFQQVFYNIDKFIKNLFVLPPQVHLWYHSCSATFVILYSSRTNGEVFNTAISLHQQTPFFLIHRCRHHHILSSFFKSAFYFTFMRITVIGWKTQIRF